MTPRLHLIDGTIHRSLQIMSTSASTLTLDLRPENFKLREKTAETTRYDSAL